MSEISKLVGIFSERFSLETDAITFPFWTLYDYFIVVRRFYPQLQMAIDHTVVQ